MNDKKTILGIVGHRVKHALQTGSSIICDPPVIDTDEDWIILADRCDIQSIQLKLKLQGFNLGGSVVMDEKTLEHPDLFWSFKRGNLNLLITCSVSFFGRFYDATELSKALNLLKKTDRIILFQAILYDNFGYTDITK